MKTLSLFLTLSFFFAFTNAALSVGNYTHVCDPKRFSDQGLDMKTFLFCDKSLPYDVRAKDLVDQMSLSEKVAQLGDVTPGVPRIGLPKYSWWSEALHGVSNVGRSPSATFFDSEVPGATSFPPVILSSASFNASLWRKIGEVVSTEARAMYNLGHAGLTFWSPNINVVRDPRWGRITETPGEDPYVVGLYGVNYVRGLQDLEGDNTTDLNFRPLKVASCCKHYAAYDVDNWAGVDRYHFDAKVTEQDMLETFLRPFEMCVKEGDVSSVMCSYNRVNGIPTCADPKLLNQTIRGEWNLHGYIVSDCDSIQVYVENAKFLNDTHEMGVAQALKAGLDLDCGDYYPKYTENAVDQGLARVGDIDRSLKYLYITLMRVGFFDGIPSLQSLGKADICSNDHLDLAAEAAREGIVLLKNDNQTLPLSNDKVKTIGVVGPHANASNAMIGNYAGVPCRYTTPVQGFSAYGKVNFALGCADVACNNDTFIFQAMEAAKNSDATILMVGLDLTVEAESLDRIDLALPGYQYQLIDQVVKVSKGPVILVVMSAGGVDIKFAKVSDKIKAIVWAGYPGEEGGSAIADIVFGKCNPGGRLPITWYEGDYVNKLPMTSMQLRPDESLGYPGRTYKFFNGSTIYPFGYGLSYTQFSYKLTSSIRSLHFSLHKYQHCRGLTYTDAKFRPPCPSVLIDDLKCEDTFSFEVQVKNVGTVDGSEVVLVYSKPPAGIAGTHLKQVIGFQRVFVRAGKSENVKFEINVCKGLGIVDYNAYSLLPSGGHTIVVGDEIISFPLQVNFQFQ